MDFEATRAAGINVTMVRGENDRMKLRVSKEERDRLLRELEQNHNGTPADPAGLNVPPPSRESIRRAREELDLLRTRAEQLRAHIAGLLSLGYKPRQFTYDSTQLEDMRAQIPRAELEVERAERAYAQFKENARRQGILPGWLR